MDVLRDLFRRIESNELVGKQCARQQNGGRGDDQQLLLDYAAQIGRPSRDLSAIPVQKYRGRHHQTNFLLLNRRDNYTDEDFEIPQYEEMPVGFITIRVPLGRQFRQLV
jgi:hypothetical protein